MCGRSVLDTKNSTPEGSARPLGGRFRPAALLVPDASPKRRDSSGRSYVSYVGKCDSYVFQPHTYEKEKTHMALTKTGPEQFTLSTGKTISPYQLVIGIAENSVEHSDFPGLVAFEGYDSTLGPDEYILGHEWTPEERKEIAEYCISLWKRWGGIE